MHAKRHVRFVGGPFDGYCQSLTLDVSNILPVALIPVCRGTFRLLGGESSGGNALVTSFAVYRLEESDSAWCYRFLRALDPASVWTKKRRTARDGADEPSPP